MSDNNGWPGKPGVPLHYSYNGFHWVQRLAGKEKPRVEEWTGSVWWTCPKFGGPENDFSEWRYLGPCLTPAEVDARVQQARRKALFEAQQRALLYANTSHQHGHLPVNPHECAAQVAMEISSSINGIDPDIRKAGNAFRRKVLEAAAQKAEAIIATERPWSTIPAAIRALIDAPSEVIIRADRDAWPDHQADDPVRALKGEGDE